MPDDALGLLERLGFPIFISLLLIYIIVKFVGWFGVEILVPVKDKLLSHFATVDSVLGGMPDTIASVEKNMERQSECLKELVAGQGETRKILEQVHGNRSL